MNLTKKEISDLDRRLRGNFLHFISEGKKKTPITDIEKIGPLVLDAIKFAKFPKQLKNLRNFQTLPGPQFGYFHEEKRLTFGPAEIIFQILPVPHDHFSPDRSAYFYERLIDEISDDDLDAGIFLQGLNYANSLLATFQSTHFFNKPGEIAELERKLRRRLLQNDCINLILAHDQNTGVNRPGFAGGS